MSEVLFANPHGPGRNIHKATKQNKVFRTTHFLRCLCSSFTPKLFESPNVRQIFTTEGGVTASKCTTTYLPEKFQKCGAMAMANNTEAEDVVACYKVTLSNTVHVQSSCDPSLSLCTCVLLQSSVVKVIDLCPLQEGLKNSSIETCMESGRAIVDPVESFTNVSACLRLYQFLLLHINVTCSDLPTSGRPSKG